MKSPRRKTSGGCKESMKRYNGFLAIELHRIGQIFVGCELIGGDIAGGAAIRLGNRLTIVAQVCSGVQTALRGKHEYEEVVMVLGHTSF